MEKPPPLPQCLGSGNSESQLALPTYSTLTLSSTATRFGPFLELCPKGLTRAKKGSRTHSEEGVSGILEDPALSDRVSNFILQTESVGECRGGATPHQPEAWRSNILVKSTPLLAIR
jgi:hypothetical protein